MPNGGGEEGGGGGGKKKGKKKGITVSKGAHETRGVPRWCVRQA